MIHTPFLRVDDREDRFGVSIGKSLYLSSRGLDIGRSSADPDPNLSLMPRMMNVLANGSIVGVAVENSWGSGIFLADWICDLDFAGPSGEVEIMGSIVMVDEIVDGLNFTPSVI